MTARCKSLTQRKPIAQRDRSIMPPSLKILKILSQSSSCRAWVAAGPQHVGTSSISHIRIICWSITGIGIPVTIALTWIVARPLAFYLPCPVKHAPNLYLEPLFALFKSISSTNSRSGPCWTTSSSHTLPIVYFSTLYSTRAAGLTLAQ